MSLISDTGTFKIAGGKTNFGRDPLCQTFFITGSASILCGVDLYLYEKDTLLPLFIEIRSVVNSKPTETVASFSRKVVYPSSINTSDDGSVSTYIPFDGLVYLEPGEYALVINSNSSRYRVWISQLGEKDTITNEIIAKQPYVGVLFKSQNSTVWVPSPEQDLKFKIYRAKFENSSSGFIDFFINTKNYETSWMETEPFQAYPNSRTCKVFHPNHGLTTGSFTKFNGFPNLVGLKGSNYSNIFGTVNVATLESVSFAVSNIHQNSYTITLPTTPDVTSITRSGNSSIIAAKDIRFDAIYPQIVSLEFGGTSINLQGKFTDLGYSLNSSFIDLNKDKITEFDTAKVLPSNVNIVNNLSGTNPFTLRVEMNSSNPYLSPLIDMPLQSVLLTHNLVNSPTYATENLDNDIITIASRNNIFFTRSSNTVGLISLPSTADRANALLIVKGTTITVSNSSVNSGTFRVLDIIDSGANIKVFGSVTTASAANVITITNGTGFIAEEAPYGGTSLSKYITRQIDFANPSTAFNLRLDISQPENASVKIYYKVKEVGDTAPFDEEEFVEIPNLDITTSVGGEFYEIETQVDNLQPFNAMMFKIVLNSLDSADIPRCKNFRVIGLA